MKMTFIARSITDEAIARVRAMPPREAHDYLAKWAFGDLRHCVTAKYGSDNSFGRRVDWNGLMKRGAPVTMQYGPRRGYHLFTFEAGR